MNETTTARMLRATHVGGPTVLLEVGGLRLLTDPTFDGAGTRYAEGPVELNKIAGPAVPAEEIGRVDAVLLSHDQHDDNLDGAGRALLPRAGRVLTTPSGAERLGGDLGEKAVGLSPWEAHEVLVEGGGAVRATAVPARHGPEGTEGITGEVTGFVVEWDGPAGGALYVSGDNVDFGGVEEVARRFRVDVAFLHLGAARFEALGPVGLSMGGAEAARVARLLDAGTVVPIHYEGWAHFGESPEDVKRAFAEAGLAHRVRWLPIGTAVPLVGRNGGEAG